MNVYCFVLCGVDLGQKMDVTENVSVVSMPSLIMNRLGVSKDFTDADRNL